MKRPENELRCQYSTSTKPIVIFSYVFMSDENVSLIKKRVKFNSYFVAYNWKVLRTSKIMTLIKGFFQHPKPNCRYLKGELRCLTLTGCHTTCKLHYFFILPCHLKKYITQKGLKITHFGTSLKFVIVSSFWGEPLW